MPVNIVNVTSIFGKTALVALTGTSATMIVNNPASSNKVIKVNLLTAANVDGSANAELTVRVHPQDDIGGTGRALISTVIIPADATLDILQKAIYLEEDMSISATASAANDIEIVCSYEEIS